MLRTKPKIIAFYFTMVENAKENILYLFIVFNRMFSIFNLLSTLKGN